MSNHYYYYNRMKIKFKIKIYGQIYNSDVVKVDDPSV